MGIEPATCCKHTRRNRLRHVCKSGIKEDLSNNISPNPSFFERMAKRLLHIHYTNQ